MKKRLVSLLIVILLLFSLSIAVFAEADRYVFDEAGHIPADECATLDELGARIQSETGAAVCVLITAQSGENASDYARDYYEANIAAENGILLVHNVSENVIGYYTQGERFAALGEEQLTAIMDAYNTGSTYFYAVHDYMILAYSYLLGNTAVGEVTPQDNSAIPADRLYDRVVDQAGVIDAGTLAELNDLADSVSETYACDVAVVFVRSLNGKYVVDYADDFYDYNGYGYGANDDGILLLISVGDREFAETTYGYGKTAFTDYGLTEYLEPRFTSYLGRDDWAGAARKFINDAAELLRQARNGQPYDVYGGSEPRQEQSIGQKLGLSAVISAVIGFFSGGIPAGSLKRQMKSVEKNYGAANYARGGLNMRRSDDRFLYANVHKTPIPRETSSRSSGSGGGSSVHFSSSGRSHGGSHGKF